MPKNSKTNQIEKYTKQIEKFIKQHKTILLSTAIALLIFIAGSHMFWKIYQVAYQSGRQSSCQNAYQEGRTSVNDAVMKELNETGQLRIGIGQDEQSNQQYLILTPK